jgi:archaellum component FlaC
MKSNPMTIEDLARMVQNGFNESNERFDKVDDQFEKVGGHFGRIDRELKAIRKELVGVVHRREFEKLEDRVQDLENLLAMVSKKAA